MSLFKLRNLWSETFPQQQFDQRHLSVGKIDRVPALALGSFAGTIRIYKINPTSPIQVEFMYQNKLQSQIVAVEFVAHPDQSIRNTVGVLLYRKFLFISFSHQENGYKANILSVNVEPSFGICRDPLCLMTVNSSIQYLNPLSTQPIKVSDPIFAYVRDQEYVYYADGEELVLVQSSTEQWRVILGPIRKICLIQNYVVVIGDNNIWEVQDAKINQSKLFDDEISCGTVARNQSEVYNVILANFQNQILIYTKSYVLIWALKTQSIPIALQIIKQGAIKGAMALLNDNGVIQICYAGSELEQTQIERLNEEVDMSQVEQQTRQLLQDIQRKKKQKETDKQIQTSIISSQTVKLKVKTLDPQSIKHYREDEKTFQKDGGAWTCSIECQINCQKQSIQNVNICILFPSNLLCYKQNVKIPYIKDQQKVSFKLFCHSQKFPYEARVEVVLKYYTSGNRKGNSMIRKKARLPANFQASYHSSELQQKPTNKIVFKGNMELPELYNMFPQFPQTRKQKSCTIQLVNGVLCSIGYNKNQTKIKIQSNFFSGLCYAFILIKTRILQLNAKEHKKYELGVDTPPLEELGNIMKDHYDQRIRVKQKYKNLQMKSQQFRSSQKKLLVKLKQKMSNTNYIDKLLEYNYDRLMEAADEYELAHQQMQIVNHNLEIALKFVLQLMFTKNSANSVCVSKAQGILGYEKQSMSFGWEQKVMSNSSFYFNKQFNYLNDKYTFEQVYKIMMVVISKINSGEWNQ